MGGEGCLDFGEGLCNRQGPVREEQGSEHQSICLPKESQERCKVMGQGLEAEIWGW